MIMWYILAIIATILYVFFIKWYVLSKNYIYIMSCILFDLLLIYCYIKLFSNGDVSFCYPFNKILSIIIVVILGIMFFNETIKTETCCGLILGLIAIYLLSI